MLKVIIHDYAGHPFQFKLAEELSKKIEVHYLYFINDAGPKGNFFNIKNKNLHVEPVGYDIKYNKENFIMRLFNDIKYGLSVAKIINKIKPDIVLSGNTPTFAQQSIIKSAKKNSSKFIFWVQDFYSLAVKNILEKKFKYLSVPIALVFKYMEKIQLYKSDNIIVIADSFLPILNKWGIFEDINHIPNWGNLDNLNNNENKDNDFSKQNNLNPEKFRLLYTGTLALKHNPDIIVKIAEFNPDIELLIVAAGSGYKKLLNSNNLPSNIKLLPLQPFEIFNNVLNTSDVCLAILNKDASNFSVPSKILNYLCAERPILMFAPKDNLASKTINEANAGKVFSSEDFKESTLFINKLKKDREYRKQLSISAGKYAKKNFDINIIANKFLEIFIKLKPEKKS